MYAGIPRVRRPRSSPTGEYIVFCWNPDAHYELFVYETEAGHCRQVTDGELHRSPNAPVIWGSSGETVYFQTGEHGYDLREIHRLDLDGAIERIATPGGDWGLLWGVDPTETWLLYTHTVDQTQRVFQHNIATNERIQLSGPDTRVPNRGIRIAPDGSRICYPGYSKSEPEPRTVYVVDSSGEAPQEISVSETERVRPQAWHPDEDHLLLYDEENHRTGEYAFETEETRWFGSGQPLAYLSPETILTNDPYLYDRTTRHQTVVSIDGQVGDELIANAVCIDANSVLFTRSSERRPTELYKYNLQTCTERRLVTTEFTHLDPHEFVTAEEISYESADGRAVEGFLYRPSQASNDHHVPVIVDAHGLSRSGMQSAAGRGFNRKIQYFVAQGYAILQPHYRGSGPTMRRSRNRSRVTGAVPSRRTLPQRLRG